MKKIFLLSSCFLTLITASAHAADKKAVEEKSHYAQTNFVANKAKYKPTIATEKAFINAWGIAIRPAGAGGHFWVVAKDKSYEYVGDVTKSATPELQKLHQDKLTQVKLPVGGEDNVGTGVVFSDSKENFVITQKIDGVADVTAPAKFLFASDGGIISAWTERKKEDGTFDRASEALTVIDRSKEGSQYFGLTLSKNYDRLYAANFGVNPSIDVFNGKFELQQNVKFDMPFDDNKNGKVDAGEYAPFNVQGLNTPDGAHNIFVTYALTQLCPAEEYKKPDSCKKGEMFIGEEETSKPGHGRVAEFTEEGKLVNVWKDGGKLSAPWGVAYAPADFGKLSGALLVGNFGDGSIAAFDAKTHEFIDTLRNTKGKPVKIEKIWGFLFGNGESLGDANTMYFAAGPDDEKDGIYGKLTLSSKK